MKHFSAIVLLSCLSAPAASAQYCSPTFPSGCFTWHSQSVSIGQIDWAYDGVDCTASDFTALSTTVDAGDQAGMLVSNGAWCGCAVWVDFDQSSSFEVGENLYTYYANIAADHVYDFTISIPQSVPTGAYRMRVISPWGSDGFTQGSQNGFGPCGDYQYGNFQDFTLNVIGFTGIADNTANAAGISVGPNPTDGLVSLTTDAAMERITVLGIDGRIVRREAFATGAQRTDLDLTAEPAGVYMVECLTGSGVRTVRVVKQ